MGQCILILISIPAIVVEYLKILNKNVNENIQYDHGYAYSLGKINFAHRLMKKVGQWWKTIFLTQRNKKNAQNPHDAKNYICSKI